MITRYICYLFLIVATSITCNSSQTLVPEPIAPPITLTEQWELPGPDDEAPAPLPLPTWQIDNMAGDTLFPADVELLTQLADAAYHDEKSLSPQLIEQNDSTLRCLDFRDSRRYFSEVAANYATAIVHPQTDRLYRNTIDRLNRQVRNFELPGATCDARKMEAYLFTYREFYNELEYLIAVNTGVKNPFLNPYGKEAMTLAEIENAEAEFRAQLAQEKALQRMQVLIDGAFNGYSLRRIKDGDGDGVSDLLDRCPEAPGPPALHGCPREAATLDRADADGDGIDDRDDECPTQPGTIENRGCPNFVDPPTPVKPTIRFSDSHGYESVSLRDDPAVLYSYFISQNTTTLDSRQRELTIEVIDYYLTNYGAEDPIKAAQARRLRDDLLSKSPEAVLPSPIVEGRRDTAIFVEPVPIDTTPVPELPCIVGTFERGVLSFNRIPAEMEPFQPYDVYIKIYHTATAGDQADLVDRIDGEQNGDDPNAATLRDPETGTVSPIRAEPLRISRYMFAEIKATNERAFVITERFDSGLQEIECGDSTTWHYIIEPQLEGRHVLLFNLYYSEDGATTFPMSEAGERREIVVSVGKSKFPAWLLIGGSVLLLGLVGLFAWFLRRRRSKSAAPVAVTARQLEALEKLVREGEIERALNRIVELIEEPQHPIRRRAVETLAMYNQAERDRNLGDLTSEQFQQKRSRATRATLDLLDRLRERASFG